jgi:hypothetical protein
MFPKSALFLLLLGSWAFAQRATESPSEGERAHFEAVPPVSQPASDNQVQPATAPSNDELLARSKTIYVITESYFVKKEELEQGLINRKELGEHGIQVVGSPDNADLILRVKRAPFQNSFVFTLTDRVTGIVIVGGNVNSLFGTVPGKIAGRLADRLKRVHAAKP